MKKIYTLAVSRCLQLFSIVLFFIPFGSHSQELMRANLYVDNPGGLLLVDGNLTNYNNTYSNAVDINDAWKMANPGINFGILRSGYNLVVERRSVYTATDTTFFRMWNMTQANYRIKFMLKNLNHPGMQAMVVDNYLHSCTLIGLNDTTFYSFSVNADPASAAELRFQLIYGANLSGGVLDVNILSFCARQQGKSLLLNWEVSGEEPTDYYVIEHAAGTGGFSEIGHVNAMMDRGGKGSYRYTLPSQDAGENFYRIKVVSRSGRVAYSTVASVNFEMSSSDFAVYPNPVVNKNMHLQFNVSEDSRYELYLYTLDGRPVRLTSLDVKKGASEFNLLLPAGLLPGSYYLKAINKNNPIVKTVNIL